MVLFLKLKGVRSAPPPAPTIHRKAKIIIYFIKIVFSHYFFQKKKPPWLHLWAHG